MKTWIKKSLFLILGAVSLGQMDALANKIRLVLTVEENNYPGEVYNIPAGHSYSVDSLTEKLLIRAEADLKQVLKDYKNNKFYGKEAEVVKIFSGLILGYTECFLKKLDATVQNDSSDCYYVYHQDTRAWESYRNQEIKGLPSLKIVGKYE